MRCLTGSVRVCQHLTCYSNDRSVSGTSDIPAVDPLDPADVPAGSGDHPQVNADRAQDERAGAAFQVTAGQRVGHGGRLPAHRAPAPPPPTQPPFTPSLKPYQPAS